MMVEKWRIISIDWAKQLLQLLDKKRILKSSRNHQFQELEKKWVNNTLINKYKIEQFWLILWLINHVFNINASVCVFVFIFIIFFILIALICYIYFNYPILFFFFFTSSKICYEAEWFNCLAWHFIDLILNLIVGFLLHLLLSKSS